MQNILRNYSLKKHLWGRKKNCEDAKTAEATIFAQEKTIKAQKEEIRRQNLQLTKTKNDLEKMTEQRDKATEQTRSAMMKLAKSNYIIRNRK